MYLVYSKNNSYWTSLKTFVKHIYTGRITTKVTFIRTMQQQTMRGFVMLKFLKDEITTICTFALIPVPFRWTQSRIVLIQCNMKIMRFTNLILANQIAYIFRANDIILHKKIFCNFFTLWPLLWRYSSFKIDQWFKKWLTINGPLI